MLVEVSVYKHTFKVGSEEHSIETTKALPENAWKELLSFMNIKGEKVPTHYDSHSAIDTGKTGLIEFDI